MVPGLRLQKAMTCLLFVIVRSLYITQIPLVSICCGLLWICCITNRNKRNLSLCRWQ